MEFDTPTGVNLPVIYQDLLQLVPALTITNLTLCSTLDVKRLAKNGAAERVVRNRPVAKGQTLTI